MRMILAAAAMAAAVGAAGVASATTFTGSYSTNVYGDTGAEDINNGLQIETQDSTPGSGLGFSFNLVGNNSATNVDLFKIYTDENDVDGDDDNHKPITVSFNFTAPGAAGGTVGGETWAINGSINKGIVTWGAPAVINFGGGFGTLTVSLNNAEFAQDDDGNDLGNSKAQITGHFVLSNVGVPVGGVPEPATWGLMITGFGMAGATLRRRRTAAAAA